MLLNSLAILAGFLLLIWSADRFVIGASGLALNFGVSPLIIGLTIVGFGTSAPELIVNIISSAGGYNEICFGDVLGSNIFNTLVVLGVAGIIYPISIQKNTVKKEIPFVLIGTIFVLALSNNFIFSGNTLSRLDGIFLILSLIIFFAYVVGIAKEKISEEITVKLHSVPTSMLYIVIGIIGLFFGGQMVVKNAVFIAQLMNVSEKFIAITIVALGTSLPELATSIIAITKKRHGLAIGNVIGSNLFNIFLVLGVSSIIKPIFFPVELNIDFYFLIIITIILFITMFTGKRRKLERAESIIFVLLYIGYVVFLFYRK